MADAFANPQDVEARWRALDTDELIVAGSLLSDASAKARSLVPGLDQAVATNPTFRDTVIAIVSASVIRVLRNPDGWRSEAIDDYSRTRDQALSAGLLDFTSDELSLLRGSTAAPRVRMGWLA